MLRIPCFPQKKSTSVLCLGVTTLCLALWGFKKMQVRAKCFPEWKPSQSSSSLPALGSCTPAPDGGDAGGGDAGGGERVPVHSAQRLRTSGISAGDVDLHPTCHCLSPSPWAGLSQGAAGVQQEQVGDQNPGRKGSSPLQERPSHTAGAPPSSP